MSHPNPPNQRMARPPTDASLFHLTASERNGVRTPPRPIDPEPPPLHEMGGRLLDRLRERREAEKKARENE